MIFVESRYCDKCKPNMYLVPKMYLHHLRYSKGNKMAILESSIVSIHGIERENMKTIFDKMLCIY